MLAVSEHVVVVEEERAPTRLQPRPLSPAGDGDPVRGRPSVDRGGPPASARGRAFDLWLEGRRGQLAVVEPGIRASSRPTVRL